MLNYNVFGHFSEILRFYATHGMAQTVAAFPGEAASFATTQGFTLILQTIFYSQVITKGFGGWANSQKGENNTVLARMAAPLLKAPVLILDGLALAMASSNMGEPLLQVGPAALNWGHVSLIALTATGSVFFATFPQALNGLLPALARAQGWMEAGRRWYFEPSRGFRSSLFLGDQQPIKPNGF